MVRELSGAVVFDPGNVATNEKLWDVYATEWSAEASWVQNMAKQRQVLLLGDEWAPEAHTSRVVEEWILPHLTTESVVGELGSGGGRVAAKVAGKCREFHCFDLSSKMLAKAKEVLGDKCCHYHHGDVAGVPPTSSLRDKFDFVYCFDVMVHMDTHTIYRCLHKIRGLLKKPGGRAFISTANLAAPDGWARFESQPRFSVAGFFFLTPETVRLLASKAGFSILEDSSSPDPSNTYYNRDYLAILSLE
ncbi:hypothetical protein CTAYLR_010748 [Chrysophaeum taylorii]|uniref:Methyltransferase domain-containing protein n=1 Tax=Chrysophaeum taylorii TaxID=2483200 RepID=A0AAD7XF26_9STRA|nr:hypothetical protein CTAYLR_010748 [Chrysophaeum taylorii]